MSGDDTHTAGGDFSTCTYFQTHGTETHGSGKGPMSGMAAFSGLRNGAGHGTLMSEQTCFGLAHLGNGNQDRSLAKCYV